MSALLTIVLPVFGIVLAGYLARRWRLLGTDSCEALNRFVYWFAFPAYLFIATARSPVQEMLNIPFLVAFVGGFVVTFVIAVAVSRRLFPERKAAQALQGLSAAFSNTGYMGIPLFITAFGNDGAIPAVIATVFNAAIAVGLTIALIELDLSPAASARGVWRDIGLGLLRNPLVTAPVLGMFASLAGFPVPAALANFCTLLGAAAGPCALFALGLFLVDQPLTGNRGEISWTTFLKLVIQPLVTWIIAVPILGMNPAWAGAAVLLAALPTGSLTFIIAQNYRIYVDRASATVLVTTACSVFTLSILLMLLGVG